MAAYSILHKTRTLAVFIVTAFAGSIQAQYGISIDGGTLYTEWPNELAQMPCVISIATDHVEAQRKPSQVVVLLDASTSMEGTPIQMAREAAQSALGSLSDDDLLAIVTFSANPSTLSPMQPLAGANRQGVISSLSRLTTQPGRDLSAGLREAGRQFSSVSGKDAGSRMIIILTNGSSDRGLTMSKDLIALADSIFKSNGAAISTIGYDRRIDESTLIGLSEHSGGRAFFVEEENASFIPGLFTREITRLVSARGTDARLSIRLPDNCQISNLRGAIMQNNELFLPCIPDNDTLRIFFNISPMPDSRREIELDLSWMDPANSSRLAIHSLIDFPIPQGGEILNEKTAPVLTAYLQRLSLEELSLRINDKRREVASELDDTLKNLEQQSVRYNGSLDAVIIPLRKIQTEMANNTVDNDILVKRLRYEPLRVIYGF